MTRDYLIHAECETVEQWLALMRKQRPLPKPQPAATKKKAKKSRRKAA